MPKNNTAVNTPQTTIPFSASDQEQLDISTLETWLWAAAGDVPFHAYPRKRISRTGLKIQTVINAAYILMYKRRQICSIYDEKFVDNNAYLGYTYNLFVVSIMKIRRQKLWQRRKVSE